MSPVKGLGQFMRGTLPRADCFAMLTMKDGYGLNGTYDKAKVLAYAYRQDDNFKMLYQWWVNV
jgi:hypothetical protein